MIVLYILLVIILFFALILSLHIKVFIRLDNELRLRVGLGPVIITLSPKKKKKVKASDFTYKKHRKRLLKEKKKQDKKSRKRAEKEEKKKQAKLLKKEAETAAKASEEATAGNKLGSIMELIKFVLSELPVFASYIKTDIRQIYITVGGKDADVTARSYGAISAILANLIELLKNKTQLRPVKDRAVGVFADFTAEKTSYRLDLYFRLRLFSIVRVGWHTLKWFISQKIQESKTQAAVQHKIQK
ncbi:MAG: hypothetical protein E7627_02605 [Ruminococcaceae bacterium]|nr:hypothetical protein [Oscillospiraceae bacterium]